MAINPMGFRPSRTDEKVRKEVKITADDEIATTKNENLLIFRIAFSTEATSSVRCITLRKLLRD